jgi:hypothetical protein
MNIISLYIFRFSCRTLLLLLAWVSYHGEGSAARLLKSADSPARREFIDVLFVTVNANTNDPVLCPTKPFQIFPFFFLKKKGY